MRVVARVDRPTHIALSWMPPGATEFSPIPSDRLYREQRMSSGLLATYRAGTNPDGPAEVTQIERYVQRFDSLPRLARPYTVDWQGTIDVPKSGIYRFCSTPGGPASLWIDDKPWARRPQPRSGLVGAHRGRRSQDPHDLRRCCGADSLQPALGTARRLNGSDPGLALHPARWFDIHVATCTDG